MSCKLRLPRHSWEMDFVTFNLRHVQSIELSALCKGKRPIGTNSVNALVRYRSIPNPRHNAGGGLLLSKGQLYGAIFLPPEREPEPEFLFENEAFQSTDQRSSRSIGATLCRTCVAELRLRLSAWHLCAGWLAIFPAPAAHLNKLGTQRNWGWSVLPSKSAGTAQEINWSGTGTSRELVLLEQR